MNKATILLIELSQNQKHTIVKFYNNNGVQYTSKGYIKRFEKADGAFSQTIFIVVTNSMQTVTNSMQVVFSIDSLISLATVEEIYNSKEAK